MFMCKESQTPAFLVGGGGGGGGGGGEGGGEDLELMDLELICSTGNVIYSMMLMLSMMKCHAETIMDTGYINCARWFCLTIPTTLAVFCKAECNAR